MEKIYLKSLKELSTIINGSDNTIYNAYAKVVVLSTMNMRYENIAFNEIARRAIQSDINFKQGNFLGDTQLLAQPDFWPKRVIAMNLDCIGSQSGPDLALLAELKRSSRSEIIAAGGVRTEQDLIILNQQGVERVLVASALHDGRINKDVLDKIYTP